MLVRRTSPLLPDLRFAGRMPAPQVPANRHRSILCKTCTKPPNPFGLTLCFSMRYPRNNPLQTHCVYLACFQRLSFEKGLVFQLESMAPMHRRVGPLCNCDWRWRVGAEGRGQCDRKSGVAAAGKKNMPTNQAGMCPEISNLPGSFRSPQGNKRAKPVRYHPRGHKCRRTGGNSRLRCKGHQSVIELTGR